MLSKDELDTDLHGDTVICPQGHTAAVWRGADVARQAMGRADPPP